MKKILVTGLPFYWQSYVYQINGGNFKVIALDSFFNGKPTS